MNKRRMEIQPFRTLVRAVTVGALIPNLGLEAARPPVPDVIREKAALPVESPEAKAARMAWWTDARFGMFIHFGLYSLPARHEWVKTEERMLDKDYDRYFEAFDPDLLDARAWARRAREAGMRYVILTAKHHEGFCLWDSAFTDYKITNTPFGRDLLKEFVEAFRTEGIRVGLYYSLIDWHHPDFTVDRNHPRRPQTLDADSYAAANVGRDMAKYRAYMKDQTRELLTKYGKIDVIWFDFSYPLPFGKGWRDWDSVGLVQLARELQPGIIIDNRLDLNDTAGGWDFITPEQCRVPAWPRKDGVRVPWETCQTFSGSWGYHRDEATWKSAEQLISMLVGTVAHGGNLILNVGPDARGRFDARATDRLEAFARWMRLNAKAVYGCTEAPAEFAAPPGTVLTYSPATKRLYVALTEYPTGKLACPFAKRVRLARFLHDGSEVRVVRRHYYSGYTGDDRDDEAYDFDLPVVKPDVEVPVIEVLLGGAEPTANWPDGLDPKTVGSRIVRQFLSTDAERYTPKGFDGQYGDGVSLQYANVSLWATAIDFTALTGEAALERELLKRFEDYYPGGRRADHVSVAKHVDYYVFGALPYAVYARTKDPRARAMGDRYADGQWEKPLPDDHERTYPKWLLDTAKEHNLDYATELAYWKRGYTPQTRLWIDDMYMIIALQTRAFAASGDRKYLERTAREMCLYLDELQLKDGPNRGLFNHAKGVPYVWGRGAGWMAAGMAMMLRELPEDSAYRARIFRGYYLMMGKLLETQRADGFWGQLVGDPEAWPETSCTAMFAYAFAVGVNRGWLPSQYGAAVRKAYRALCGKLDEHANLADVCMGTGAFNDRDYYLQRKRINGDPHGQAPLLWLCTELLQP